MTRNDFKEVHAMIASHLEDQGYGGHERISTKEKLAVFLRYVYYVGKQLQIKSKSIQQYYLIQ